MSDILEEVNESKLRYLLFRSVAVVIILILKWSKRCRGS